MRAANAGAEIDRRVRENFKVVVREPRKIRRTFNANGLSDRHPEKRFWLARSLPAGPTWAWPTRRPGATPTRRRLRHRGHALPGCRRRQDRVQHRTATALFPRPRAARVPSALIEWAGTTGARRAPHPAPGTRQPGNPATRNPQPASFVRCHRAWATTSEPAFTVELAGNCGFGK